MKIAVDAFNAKGLPISVCGELGGNAEAAPILIGLGIRKL
jgi:phosphoenolpyruvate-protein kinase (PTS system EI component)